MPSFLNLSLDVRLEIYQLSLLTDSLIIPYLNQWEKEDGQPPAGVRDHEVQMNSVFLFEPTAPLKVSSHLKNELALGLLSANRQISAEAKVVFYGSNRWMLSASLQRSGGDMHQFMLLWKTNIKLFRHVHVSLDMRDLHPNDLKQIADRGGFDHMEEQHPITATMQSHHDTSILRLGLTWARKLLLLCQMRLTSLSINVADCYCPTTCCRMVEALLLEESLLLDWTNNKPPQPQNRSTKSKLEQRRLLHRHLDRHFEGERSQHQSDFRPTWSRLPSIDNLEIRLYGLRERKKFHLAHDLGFGCSECQAVDGVCDTDNYNWLNNVAVWHTRRFSEEFFTDKQFADGFPNLSV